MMATWRKLISRHLPEHGKILDDIEAQAVAPPTFAELRMDVVVG